MKLKEHLSIIIFVLISGILNIYSFIGDFDSSHYDLEDEALSAKEKGKIDDSSLFKKINYFLINNSKKSLELTASELILSDNNSILKAQNPIGVLYRNEQDKDDLDPIKFKSLYSHGLISSQQLHLRDEVEVFIKNARLKSNLLDIYEGGKLIEASGKVDTLSLDSKTNDQLIIKSEEVIYRPDDEFFEYKTNVREIGRAHV